MEAENEGMPPSVIVFDWKPIPLTPLSLSRLMHTITLFLHAFDDRTEMGRWCLAGNMRGSGLLWTEWKNGAARIKRGLVGSLRSEIRK
ncbi:hypothetical protein L1887_23942 [Cichorium endivia]|nr:hypothetical protein L1887_23942 [Cichorium endivia]